MKVINLKKCPSTQAYLTNFISKFPEFISGPTLITTKHQTSGFGRKGNDWEFFPGSLAMSFTLQKKAYNHLTPLAIGIFCCEFFKTKKIILSLKWPNDLMNSNSEKVGGIICQQAEQLVVCGLGINFNQKDIEYSSININERSQNLAKDLYSFILDKSYDTKTVVESWNKLCCHQGKQVQIIDANSKTQGRFIGIDSNGSAQVDNTLEIKTVSSGSLFF